jgi:hypothetical protein
MAPKDIYDSKHWRDRATEMRALAESMSNSKPTLLLSDLADDYDKLADRAEVRRERDRPALGASGAASQQRGAQKDRRSRDYRLDARPPIRPSQSSNPLE